MNSFIANRGPDSEGIWIDEQDCLALGHRRLAIIDLTDSGSQPMTSRCGRYVIVFNGEIYNYKDLKRKVKNQVWSGGSDTEVLLACIEEWGLEETITQCVGMFALALWDRKFKLLKFARDRMGEKPLYYGWIKNTLVFG